MVKKISIFLLILVLIFSFSLSAFAQTKEVYVYNIGNVTVIFDESDTFDADTREVIAHKLVHGDDGATSYGLMCTLFGHKYDEKTVTTITHCVEPDQPRCLEEHFIVQVCSRCDDTIVERIGYTYINCCP